MYKISDEYKNVIENKTSLSPKCKIVVDGIEYTSKVIKTFPKIKHKSEKIFGGFPAKTCEFEIYDLDNSLNFANKEIFVYKGLIINNKVEYIPQGIFVPKAENITTNISQKTIQLKDVQDKTRFFDEQYVSDLDWTITHTGLEIVQEICTKLAIELANKTFNWANFNFKRPNFKEQITYREVISRLAEIGGSIAFINRDGKLEIKSQTPTGNTISRKRYTNPTREDQIGPYNTIVLGREGINNDIVYPEIINEDRVEFKILDNPFVDLYREEMIEEVAKYIIGKSIIPFSLTDFVDGFYYDLNDTLEIIDRTGKTFTGVILNYESTSRIKSNISTEIQESTPTNYNLAGSQKQLLGQVKLDVDHANKRIDGLVSDVSNNAEKITRLEATTDGIKTSVSTVEKDLATTNSNLEQTNKNVDGLSSKIDGVSADFKEFKDNEYVQSIENLQDQIDGAIQFWNGSAIPTINNYPANEWTTENDRNNHRADIYTVIEDVNGELKQGKSYRFDKVNGVWQWIELTDNELSAVQALAQQALDKSNKNSDDIGVLNKKASEFEQTDSEIKASVDELNNRYEQDITIDKKVEGYPIVVENAGAYNVEELKVYGNSEQDTRSGKNYWNNDLVTTEGIVEKLDTGFRITKSETQRFSPVITLDIPKGNYKLVGKINTNALSNASGLQYSYEDGTSITSRYNGSITFSENVVNLRLYIDTNEVTGTYYEVTDFMIIKSDEEDETYEPYGAMPSPEYPSPIRNVEPIENLFFTDIWEKKIFSSNLPVGADASQYITINSFDGNNVNFTINRNEWLEVISKPIKLKPNTKYQIFYERNNSDNTDITRCFIYNYNINNSKYSINRIGVESGNNKYSFDFTTNSDDYIVIGFAVGNASTDRICNIKNIMISEENSSYVPFGNWLKGKITGRNILNIPNDEITLIKSSKRTVDIYPITPLILEKGTYTISFPDLVLQNNKNDIAVDLVGSNYNNLVIKDNKATFIIDNKVTIKYLYIFINRNDNDNATATFSQIQIEEGDTATDYEPYKEKEFLYNMDKENLFDINNVYGNYNIEANGNLLSSSHFDCSNLIKLSSNNLTILHEKTDNLEDTNIRIAFYDDNSNFISRIAFPEIIKTINVPSNAKYMRYAYNRNSIKNIIIYQSTSSLPYHELSKISDTKDDLDFISGVLNNKIGRIVLTGDETTWKYVEGTNFHKIASNNIISNVLSDGLCICTHFNKGVDKPNSFYLYSNNWLDLFFDTSMSEEQCKQFLKDQYNAETPVTVYYVLETPEKIQLNPINIDLFKGYNRITLEDKYGIVEEAEMTYLTDSKLNAQYATKAELDLKSNEIKTEINTNYSTKSETNQAKQDAIDSANNTTEDKLKSYSTTTEMNNVIDQKITDSENSITSSVATTYSTKAETNQAKQEAINSSNTATDNKLKNYTNTTDMNSAIDNAKDEAESNANDYTDNKLVSYSTTVEMNNVIDQKIDDAENSITSSLNNTITETRTEFEEAVNNIEIGGRNLLLGTATATGDVERGTGVSNKIVTDLFDGITGVKTNTSWSGQYFNLKNVASRKGFEVGDKLVASVYIKADQDVTGNLVLERVTRTGNVKEDEIQNAKITTAWQQFSFPFVADSGSLDRIDARIEFDKATGDNYLYWAGWKLEKGTKSSDWTPAPEDTDSQINTAKNDAISSANSSTDNKLKSYSTTTEMNNTITQKITDAENSLTSSLSKSITEAKTEAINSANSSTDNKLKSYSTTTQMNNTIDQKITDSENSITASVNKQITDTEGNINKSVDGKLKLYILKDEDDLLSVFNVITDRVVINSLNFKLSADGTLECTNAFFKDGKIAINENNDNVFRPPKEVFDVINTKGESLGTEWRTSITSSNIKQKMTGVPMLKNNTMIGFDCDWIPQGAGDRDYPTNGRLGIYQGNWGYINGNSGDHTTIITGTEIKTDGNITANATPTASNHAVRLQDLDKRTSTITAWLDSDQNLTPSQYGVINVNLNKGYSTGLFTSSSFYNGGIRIPDGISYVRVSGLITFVVKGPSLYGAYIVSSNSGNLSRTFMQSTGSGETYLSISIPPRLVKVNSGELITLGVYFNSGTYSATARSYDGSATYLTIEAVA